MSALVEQHTRYVRAGSAENALSVSSGSVDHSRRSRFWYSAKSNARNRIPGTNCTEIATAQPPTARATACSAGSSIHTGHRIADALGQYRGPRRLIAEELTGRFVGGLGPSGMSVPGSHRRIAG
eukprot:2033201-Rhodomonas_salina.5